MFLLVLLVIIMILFQSLMRVIYEVRGMHKIFYDFVKSINARYTWVRVIFAKLGYYSFILNLNNFFLSKMSVILKLSQILKEITG